MKIVHYDPTAYAVATPDSRALDHAKRLLSPLVNEIVVSNYLVILAVRVLAKQGLINYQELEIHYQDKIVKIDADGSQDHHPDGFGDELDKLFLELHGL